MTTDKQDQLFLCVRTQLYKQIKQDLLSILGMKFPPLIHKCEQKQRILKFNSDNGISVIVRH